MESNVKLNTVSLRLSHHEKQKLEARAKASKMSVAEYVRSVSLGDFTEEKIKEVVRSETKDVCDELYYSMNELMKETVKNIQGAVHGG